MTRQWKDTKANLQVAENVTSGNLYLPKRTKSELSQELPSRPLLVRTQLADKTVRMMKVHWRVDDRDTADVSKADCEKMGGVGTGQGNKVHVHTPGKWERVRYYPKKREIAAAVLVVLAAVFGIIAGVTIDPAQHQAVAGAIAQAGSQRGEQLRSTAHTITLHTWMTWLSAGFGVIAALVTGSNTLDRLKLGG